MFMENLLDWIWAEVPRSYRTNFFDRQIISDPFGVPKYNPRTNLEVVCYTKSEMRGLSGNIRGESTWLKTKIGCYVNKLEVESKENVEAVLEYCAPPKHWVGTLKPQYNRVDCYDCTSLDCPSRNVGWPPYVDLACYVGGEVVQGNR
jgi:hypothetical protein